MSHNFRMGDWAKDKKDVWSKVVAKYGGNPDAFDWGTWAFFDWAVGKAWPTVGTVAKARKFGWTRFDDSYDCYIDTFRSFENAGILPLSGKPSPAKSSQSANTKRAPNPAEAVEARAAQGK